MCESLQKAIDLVLRPFYGVSPASGNFKRQKTQVTLDRGPSFTFSDTQYVGVDIL